MILQDPTPDLAATRLWIARQESGLRVKDLTPAGISTSVDMPDTGPPLAKK